jgi:hypothetical protein
VKARLDSLSAVQARAALARGPLILHHVIAERPRLQHWRFGRRLFNADLIGQLIQAGEAVRDGDTVRKA